MEPGSESGRAAGRGEAAARCVRCGYDLAGQRAGESGAVRCPECGEEMDGSTARLTPWPRWWVVARGVCGPCVANIALVLAMMALAAAFDGVEDFVTGSVVLLVVGFLVTGLLWPALGAEELAARHVPRMERRRVVAALALGGIAANVVVLVTVFVALLIVVAVVLE